MAHPENIDPGALRRVVLHGVKNFSREDCRIAPDDLHRHLVAKLPRFALPKYIRLVSELPKTGTHRTMKHVLKEAGVTADTWRAPDPAR